MWWDMLDDQGYDDITLEDAIIVYWRGQLASVGA